MPNYALDALQGYQAVDNIYRQKRQDAIDLEDREYNKNRQKKYDARQDVLMQREDQAYTDKQTLRDADVAETEMIFGKQVAQNPQAVAKVTSMAKDPQRVGEMLALHDDLSGYLSAGKTPPQDLLVKMMNLTGSEELQARGGDDGLERKVESIVPSPVPGHVMIGFSVKDKDGKTYNAPMTTGASADPADNIVQSVPVSKVMEWVGGATSTAKALAIARAKAGDRSFLESYHAAIASRQAANEARLVKAADRTADLQDYELKKRIDQQYQKPQGPVAAGKYGMFYNGKFIENPMTKGLNDGEWETVTDPETGEETMRRTGKRGAAEKQTVKQNDDGSFSVYDPATRKASVVYPPQVADKIADEQAQAWADQEGEGVLNSRPSAEEIQAKKVEFLQELSGGQPGAAAGKGAPGGFQPGQKLVQNGVEYVVDENGVPQQQGAGQAAAATKANPSHTKETPPKQEQATAEPDPAEARMLELEGQRKAEGSASDLVSTAGLDTVKKGIKNFGAAAVDGTKKDAQLGLDLYSAFVGQPFLDLLSQASTFQEKQRAQFTIDQRYKNGTMTADEYKQAYAILNSK